MASSTCVAYYPFLSALDVFNCFTYKHLKTRLGRYSLNQFLFMENNESSDFEAANDFDFLAP